jgi:hypothetical protein
MIRSPIPRNSPEMALTWKTLSVIEKAMLEAVDGRR